MYDDIIKANFVLCAPNNWLQKPGRVPDQTHELDDDMENGVSGEKESAMNIVLRNRCLKLFYSNSYWSDPDPKKNRFRN